MSETLHPTNGNGLAAHSLQVVKRDGSRQTFLFDKLFSRIERLCYSLDKNYVDPTLIINDIMRGVVDGISTDNLDAYIANYISTLSFEHPDFSILAGRISVTNLQKRTSKKFSTVIEQLRNNKDIKSRISRPLIAQDVYEIIMNNKERIDSSIIHKRDFDFSYFGLQTLKRNYLLKCDEKVIETPQFMFMRVAIGIHKNDIDLAIETYNLMSNKFFIHGSPTLFKAGHPKPQLSSCYLLTITDDSIEGIYETTKRCALISKSGGGIGLNIHKLRAINSSVMDLPKCSSGLVPVMKLYDATCNHVSQNLKRPGAFAVYLEPWHFDIVDFVQLRLNHGREDRRCRNLFLALWIPDLFMKRVENDEIWSLMSPNESPGLDDCWGEEFEELYVKYETEKRYRKQVKARDLWKTIVASQCETGLPYMLYKDACNRKSNQQNLGTIKCANLCTEIIEYSSPDEVAVCNLASIALNSFVNNGHFDFLNLRHVTKVVTKNLNKIIEINEYPIPEARLSNMRHRPIGIGVQGLADAFILMRYPFTSPEARNLNKQIFETIYYGALEASCELAKQLGPYETYKDSPVSKGILQFDMWNVKPTTLWDWDELKAKIKQYGVRNSLLIAPMPTATTAQILGNNEAIEPYTSNMYTRRVTKGDFQIVNHHLVHDLIKLNLWNEQTRDNLIHSGGSVSDLLNLPQEYKDLYKTVWEIKQSDLIDMAADRGAFIDQSQSLNLFIDSPTYSKCTTLHFRAWKSGLKTGMYYLRSKPSVNPVKFSLRRRVIEENVDGKILGKLAECKIINGVEEVEPLDTDDCHMCSS